MKTTSLFTIVFLLLAALCLGGCKDTNDCNDPADPLEIPEIACLPQIVSGKKADITGKWQLLTVGPGYLALWINPGPIDLSCDKIMYEFSANRTLKVTSDHEWFTAGTYGYSYHASICYPDYNLRLIDEKTESYCTVMPSVMLILTPGHRMLFGRIK